MGSAIWAIAFGGITVFLVAVLARVVMWKRMPIHVRWELYPVPHEGEKADYGGSYLEESQWWSKPRHFSVWGEIRAMVPEILFLVALKEHNPPMWRWSFPFHFGLYMVSAGTALMILHSILTRLNLIQTDGSFGSALILMITGVSVAGLLLGLLGATGLLRRRMVEPDLKDFSAPADLFNLILFIVVFGFSLLGFVLFGGGFFHEVSAFISALVLLEVSQVSLSIWPAVSVILMSLLLAYIPLTHMSHFIGKYFAYHAVRWNDSPNLPGSKEEKVIQEALAQPITWSAPHIKGDGKKSWLDVATENPEGGQE